MRRRGAQVVGLELQAVVAVVDPGAARLDVFAGQGVWQVANDRDKTGPPVGLDAQHRKAVFRVVERDALDDTRQGLRHEAILQVANGGKGDDGTGKTPAGPDPVNAISSRSGPDQRAA